MNPRQLHQTSWMILFIALATSGILMAENAEVDVTSTVNATRISLHDKLVFTVTMTGPHFIKDTPLRPAPSNDFDVIWISTMHRWYSNMKIAVSETYIFIPKKCGIFKIGKLDSGRGHEKAPIHTIEVTDGPLLLSQKNPESFHTVPWGDYALFITSSVNTREPYVGEQVTITFDYFDNIHDTESKFASPAMVGLYVVDLPDNSDNLTKIDGIYYWNNEYHTAIFPTRKGKLTIGKGELSYSSKKGLSSQWGILYSPPITLHVKPLPDENKPSHFSGAVGNFTLTASAYPLVAAANEEITLKVTVEGNGNLGMIQSVVEPDLSSFKIYDRSEKENISNKYDRQYTVGGAKSWLYSMIPLKYSSITIEPFTLSFFNPEDRKYHSLSTSPIILNVLEDTTVATSKKGIDNQQSVIENIASDIRYIKPDKQILTSVETGVHPPWYFILLYVLPPTFFVASAALKKRHDLRAHDRTLIRRKAAWKNARQLLDEASQLLDEGDIRGCYCAIQTCIVSFIEDKFDLLPGMVNSLSLPGTLADCGVPEKLAGQVVRLVELCNRIEFSPDSFQSANHRHALDDAGNLIRELKETI